MNITKTISNLIFIVMSLIGSRVLTVPESKCLMAVNVNTDGAELETKICRWN